MLKKLANAFADLRALVDQGLLSYPYSTREALGIVKHLQAFPNDSFEEAMENIFSFDMYDTQVREHVVQVFLKHGFPVNLAFTQKAQARDTKFNPSRVLSIEYKKKKSTSPLTLPKHGKRDPKNCPHVGGNTWAGGTGGRTTAGLGGAGGPYRLDLGHQIYQVSQEEKDAVPKEIKEAAQGLDLCLKLIVTKLTSNGNGRPERKIERNRYEYR